MPAARAGLSAGDVMTAINGNPVRKQDDLFLHIAAALAGTEAENRGAAGRPADGVQGPGWPSAAHGKFADGVIAANRPKPVYGLRVDYASVLRSVRAAGRRPGQEPGAGQPGGQAG